VALAVVVLVGALLVGRLSGGSLGALANLPVRRRWIVLAALLAQLGGGGAGLLSTGAARPLYAAGLALSAVLVVGFLATNRRLPGVPLVAAGLLANALAVGLNGAMPVSLDAAARAGVATGPIAAGLDPRHTLAGPGTRLANLGDVVPVVLPLRPEVASPGDVAVVAGLALLVVTGMRAGRPTSDPDPAPRPSRPGGGWGVPPENGRVPPERSPPVAKKKRKRRARAKSKANHGKRPNT